MSALPNPFISSAALVPDVAEAAVSKPLVAPSETAAPISVSDGVLLTSLPSAEMELSATTARALSETEGAVSVSAASSDNHIHEIFVYARKLLAGHPDLVGFVLDEAAFMAEVEEIPLFIREDGYLRRREA